MVWLACTCGWTDGLTDGRTDGRTDGLAVGRTYDDIVLIRRDREKSSDKYFREFEKILHVHLWSGLRAPVDGRTEGQTGRQTDGRTD